jgi:hypothetical protein
MTMHIIPQKLWDALARLDEEQGAALAKTLGGMRAEQLHIGKKYGWSEAEMTQAGLITPPPTPRRTPPPPQLLQLIEQTPPPTQVNSHPREGYGARERTKKPLGKRESNRREKERHRGE